MSKRHTPDDLTRTWNTDRRWRGVTRPYTAGEVDRLRGRFGVQQLP